MNCYILWGTKRQIRFFKTFIFRGKWSKHKADGTTEEVDQSDTDFDCLAWKFTQHFVISVMRIFERARFTKRNPKPGDPFEGFLRDLYSLIKT